MTATHHDPAAPVYGFVPRRTAELRRIRARREEVRSKVAELRESTAPGAAYEHDLGAIRSLQSAVGDEVYRMGVVDQLLAEEAS